MKANQNDIPEWISEGQRINATHLIAVYNASSQQDFPVYVMSGENFQQKLQFCNVGSCAYITYFSL